MEKTTLGFEVNISAPNARELFGDLLRDMRQLQDAGNITINFGGTGRATAGTGAGGAAQAVRNSTQTGSSDFQSTADARNYYAGRVGDIRSQLEGTTRSQDRRGLYEQGFNNQRTLHDVQAAYDASIPTAASRGQRTIADIHEDMLRENERRSQKAARQADDGVRRQQRDESFVDKQQDRIDRQHDNGIKRQQADYAFLDRQDDRQARDRFRAGQAVRDSADSSEVWGDRISRYSTGVLKGGMAAAGQAGAAAVHILGEERLTGRADLPALGALPFQFAGGVLGAGIGSFFGGFGSIIGAGIGGQIGKAAGDYAMAPFANILGATDAMSVLQQTVGSRQAGYTVSQRDTRLTGIVDAVRGPNEGLNRALRALDPFGFQTQQVAEGYTDVTEGMIAGGVNPYGKATSGVYYGPDTATLRDHRNGVARDGKAIQGGLRYTIDEINAQARGPEQYSEAVTRRAFGLFRNRAPEVLKEQAALFASTPETGGNTLDMLQEYGALKTERFLKLTHANGAAGFTVSELSDVNAGLRRNERALKLAGLQARGAGQAAETILDASLDTARRLPDGENSLTYAQLGAQRRQARSAKWEESDYLTYGQPMLGLETEQAIHQALPYQPGYDYGQALRRMGLRAGQLATLANRYTEGMKNPADFGVDQQRATYAEYQGLRVQQAQDVAVLAEGGEDRAMLLAAGRGNSRMRYDSEQLAATAVYNIGSPRRSHGAVNGQQLAMQNAFLHKYDTPDFDAAGAAMPKDRMTGMDSTQVVGLLARIAEAVESRGKGMGSSVNPGEARSMVSGALALTDVLGMPAEEHELR